MNSIQLLQMTSSFVAQASILIAVTWALERTTGCAKVKARLWSTCFASIVLMLLADALLPHRYWLHPWEQWQAPDLLSLVVTEQRLVHLLLPLWLLGTSALLVRWIAQFASLQLVLLRCPRLPSTEAHRVSRSFPSKQSIRGKAIEFRFGPDRMGPFCYQFHRPIICLPAHFFQRSDEELRQVLAHEMAHLETSHPRQLFFQKLVQALLWFHPFVWIAARRASLVREFVCDDAAVRSSRSVAAYLQCLVSLIESPSATRPGTFAAIRSHQELRQRAHRLSRAHADHKAMGKGIAVTLILWLSVALAWQVWLPTNPLASPGSRWSPWPTWTAQCLHSFGVSVRDYETFTPSRRIHEWQAAAARLER